ncbi:MAG TPA: glutathione S-transferase family protein [Stellaceae bacterium]|nr:glutathione S-transferase family protein [Stellaceae bacterium]
MPIQLYDLAGADPKRRFSPNCWRVTMALAHKGLAFETIPWRFTDKPAIAFSGQGNVPLIIDGDAVVPDSWEIARHLEAAYPDRPSLFGGPAGHALSQFIANWTDTVVHPGVARLILLDIHDMLAEVDKAYFRSSREARYGRSLEAVVADRDVQVIEFRKSLSPLRRTLDRQPFIAGEHPAFADYIVFGAFQWARTASTFAVLTPDDPVSHWRDRLLDAFDGLARATPSRGE